MRKTILISVAISAIFTGEICSQTEVDSKAYQEEKGKKQEVYLPQAQGRNYLDPLGSKMVQEGRTIQNFQSASFELGCPIENPALDSTYFALPPNDDGSLGPKSLPFSFDFFGSAYSSVYINNNGNISFGLPYSQFSPTGFPSEHNMIAPFWADVDTRVSGGVVVYSSGSSGGVYYKVEATRFTVVWYQVGYYDQKVDKRNTFKLVITDGEDPDIGIGNNVAMFYGDMAWTTGDASGGINGLGGVPATVGMNKSLGGVNCFFYQVGRFGKAGNEFVDPFQTSGVDYLDNRCFYFNVGSLSPISLDFEVDQFQCGLLVNPDIVNPSGCEILSVTWDFGDGSSSDEFAPIHAYESYGNYSIRLDIVYACGPCGEDSISKTRTVELVDREILYADSVLYLVTRKQEDVVGSSSQTYGGNWVFDIGYGNAGEFYDHFLGIWRPENNYFFNELRGFHEDPRLAIDGTFDLNWFNWRDSHVGLVPNWEFEGGVIHYSLNSQVKEAVDALGIYSASTFDTKGELVTAQGVNTRNLEMAFTGFETYENGASGNWVFGTQSGADMRGGRVPMANKYFAVVDRTLEALEEVDSVSLVAIVPDGVKSNLLAFEKVAVLCKSAHSEDSTMSVLTLSVAPSPQIWRGYIVFDKDLSSSGDALELDQAYAHTGKASMKVTGSKSYPQELLQLVPGKAYHLSAWMSVKGNSQSMFEEGLGIEVSFDGIQNPQSHDIFIRPSGPVIEGWQQVKGTIQIPENGGNITLVFKSGSKTSVWVDDLRLFPEDGNLKAYVYEPIQKRVAAILDEENFSTLFFYNQEGKLFLVKKETTEGILTISESSEYLIRRDNN